MRIVRTFGVALCGAAVLASVAAAQRPVRREAGTPASDEEGVAIALQAGGASYQFSGPAECKHEPKGYIYMVPAKLWTVSHSEGQRSVTLSFWRPAAGSADMFNLYVSMGGKTHHIDTVKTKDGGDPTGSGQVTFTPAGSGGVFTLKATSASGVTITGTIKCDRFGAIVAEGGN